jgi:hypothetical protein
MEKPLDIPRLIALRKLTAPISSYFENQLADYLSHLAPLLHPTSLLGEFIRYSKIPVKQADQAFQALGKLYQSVITARPFHSSISTLMAPLDVFGSIVEFSRTSYIYKPQADPEKREITVSSPLRWVLHYKGFDPEHLTSLIASIGRGDDTELKTCLLHFLVLNLILGKPTGAAPLLAALRLPVSFGQLPEFGNLPLLFVTCPICTVLPSDDIIIQTVELSVVSLSFRDEHPHFSDTLAFSMEVMVPSRKSAWTGKRCIVRTIGASITENLLKLDG